MSQDKDTPKPGESDTAAYQRPADGDDAYDNANSDAQFADAKDELAEQFEQADDASSFAEEAPVEAAAVPVAAKRPSRIPGFLTALIALGALGLSGYLYYELRYLDPLAPFEKRMDELANRAERNKGELEERSNELTQRSESMRSEIQSLIDTASAEQTSQANSLRDELADQQDNLEAAQAALAESLGETISATPPTSRDWKLAEAEYLLRIANHRLLMEQDVITAEQLLSSADQILTELGDFSLYDVRAQLAEEMLALSALTSADSKVAADLTGLFLQLDAIKNNLHKLPNRAPEYLAAKVSPQDTLEEALAEEPAASESAWEQVVSRMSSFFEYRRIGGEETRQPLLSPDESVYLEMNLRLMLERSQVALLRRNQLMFESSLGSAAEWMETYFDPNDDGVVRSRESIEALLTTQLDLPLPDISGSLNALQKISRGQEN